MKLSAQDAKKDVVGVRISRRQGSDDQASNVKITIGSSEAYDAGDPVCTVIPILTQQVGSTMVDYNCDQGQHSGEYVKFSNGGQYLTICEAAVMIGKDCDDAEYTSITVTVFNEFNYLQPLATPEAETSITTPIPTLQRPPLPSPLQVLLLRANNAPKIKIVNQLFSAMGIRICAEKMQLN